MRFSGEFNEYVWIEWDDRSAFLNELISLAPSLVLGKYLVNTSFDSGKLPLGNDEITNGWSYDGALTLSPEIRAITMIPVCQYDEWYIFETPKQLEDCEAFVNYCGFSLHNALYA